MRAVETCRHRQILKHRFSMRDRANLLSTLWRGVNQSTLKLQSRDRFPSFSLDNWNLLTLFSNGIVRFEGRKAICSKILGFPLVVEFFYINQWKQHIKLCLGEKFGASSMYHN